MAEIMNIAKEEKKGRHSHMNLRVDFTPMVDMNLLLITFFMICTTLSKPQSLKLTIPSNEKENITPPKVNAEKAITIILGKDNKLYYYLGKPDYKKGTNLKTSSFDAQGIRQVLLSRNQLVVKKINELKKLRQNNQLTEVDFSAQSKRIRNDDNALTVLIKPTENSTYDNLVKILDEMHICNIGKYTLINMTAGDNYMLNHFTKIKLSIERKRKWNK